MTPLEFLYYTGYLLKKRSALGNRKRLPCRVVSIGNITTGGTGKTPAAIALAEEAKKRGFRPIVLTRGYRGRAKGPCFVQATNSAPPDCRITALPDSCSSVRDAGDEPVVMAERLCDAPVVKCADRYRGGMFALQSLRADEQEPFLFILDDGFQHWKLYRDVDIVLIDGLDPFGNGKMLPLGPLRGPLSELHHADLLVVTKARNVSLERELREDVGLRAPVYTSEYRVRGLRDGAGGAFPARELEGKKVYAFCGLASPESFVKTIGSLGGQVCGLQAYRDHHAYTEADVTSIRASARERGCDFIITTEKDMVKIRELNAPETLLCLEVEWTVDKYFYDTVFRRIE